MTNLQAFDKQIIIKEQVEIKLIVMPLESENNLCRKAKALSCQLRASYTKRAQDVVFEAKSFRFMLFIMRQNLKISKG